MLNAAVMPLATAYLDDLRARLPAGRALHLLHSAGGMMSVEAAKARPLTMAMSGPAAGVAAAAHIARTLGIGRALAFDMGGTTTDVCLIADGVPETAAQRKLGDYPVRLPMLAVESIGAGGGSIACVEAATGALKVGPRSAGAVPGPACYGLGGTRADGDRREPDPRLSESRSESTADRSGSTAAAPRRRSRRLRSASASRSSTPRTAWWRWPTPACCARCGWSPCSAATICASSR